MKLCRFVLNQAPDQARSGIYHEGKVYETDGERAIGIHEPGSVSLLPPLGTPPGIRVFEFHRATVGDRALSYRFQNTTGLYGPNSDVEIISASTAVDFDVHVVGTVADTAQAVDPGEAPSFALGYGLMLVFYDADMAQDERTQSIPIGPSHDLGCVIGPYLTTPEDLTEFTVGSDPTNFAWNLSMKVNETAVAKASVEPGIAFSDLLSFVTRIRTVQAGEVLAWPAFDKPALEDSPLGRGLVAEDRVEVTVDGLGTLVARIA
ncbi:MAG TPA: fumarylacetoacetate hydrolase family protein [Fimbriimonadaceae bacterium]|nr:fumarylacetoacetate hydrolase family protein [Fimbriimonadaceae bacterium]